MFEGEAVLAQVDEDLEEGGGENLAFGHRRFRSMRLQFRLTDHGNLQRACICNGYKRWCGITMTCKPRCA